MVMINQIISQLTVEFVKAKNYPVLFSLYLHDLEEFLARQDNQGLILHDDILDIYFEILVLLYADDTVLFANNPIELQLIFDNFQEY